MRVAAAADVRGSHAGFDLATQPNDRKATESRGSRRRIADPLRSPWANNRFSDR